MNFTEARDLLIQYNMWRRDNNVPNKCEMPDPTEIGVAVDKAINCLDAIVRLFGCDSYEDIISLCEEKCAK